MKHLKSYDELNESLTRGQRAWLNSPILIGSILLKKLTGIYPLLNFRWKEIKKKTTDSDYDPLVSTSSNQHNAIGDNITKIKISDIPSPKIKISMFLRGWNVYLIDRDMSHDKGRKLIYLSKDELKMGDKIIGERLSDHDIYTDDIGNNPVIVLVAKIDDFDKSKELQEYIDYVCLDMNDEYNVEIKTYVNPQQDKVNINIENIKEPDSNRKNLTFNDELSGIVDDISDRILSLLKGEGKKGFKSKISYEISGIYYFGNAGRFPEIIKIAKDYDRRNDSEYYNSYASSDRRSLNLSFCNSRNYTIFDKRKADMQLTTLTKDDMKVLVDDIKNCSSQSLTIKPIDSIKVSRIIISIVK